MAETRTDRTDYLGLLALMVAAADTHGWAYPYWNMLQLDAALNGLANAARTGAVPLNPPAVAPDLSLLTAGGALPGGRTIEVVQTFVDEWGRETAAGTQGSIFSGDALADPAVAPTPGTPTTEATGYGGGPLMIVFTWVDGNGGETMSSPAATVQLPYLAGNLYSQLDVTLPSTPAAAGAAQAWIYIQHRDGNVVLAKKITDPDQDTVTLDGNTADCYLTPPYTNTTGSTRAIEITGQTDAAAERTRFYVRQTGEEWTTGDHRLTVGGADEWDIATVSYPLVYTGTNLTAGWPPTVSQVKAIRPIDLETETSGTLDQAHLPDEAVLEQELARSLGEALMSGCEVTAHAPADMGVNVGAGEVILAAGRFVYDASTDLVIPEADPDNPRIDLICIADAGTIEGPTENVDLKGTPGTSPAAPSTPNGYIKLAEVNVGNGATTIVTGDITDARVLFTTLLKHETDSTLHFTGTEKTDRLPDAADLAALTGGGQTELHSHPGTGLSDLGLLRHLHTMLVLCDTDYTLRERLADAAFLDNFTDTDGTDTGETYDALDTINERLDCAIGALNPAECGSTETLWTSGSYWIGQRIDSSASARVLGSFAMRLAGATGGTVELKLYTYNPSTQKATGLVYDHTAQDFATGQTVNGHTGCILWENLNWDLLAGQHYVVWAKFEAAQGSNIYYYDQATSDFGSDEDGVYYNSAVFDPTTTQGYSWNSNVFAVQITFPEITTTTWTSEEITVPGGIWKLFADWHVTQEPVAGGTITAEVKYGTGAWGALAKAVSIDVPDGPTTVRFRFTLSNTDPATEVWIDDFGAVWETVPA